VKDVERLRAAIFERTGIPVGADDPLMAVLVASSFQTEEVCRRLLKRASPVRAALVSATFGVVLGSIGAYSAWQIAAAQAQVERVEWLRQQANPRTAALLRSEEGRAGLRLAELGVATLLAGCKGRDSWRTTAGYCIPMTPDGKPDGFRFSASSNQSSSRGKQ
jgi:hypothetical protein